MPLADQGSSFVINKISTDPPHRVRPREHPGSMTWPVVSTGELQSNPPVVLISCVKKKKPEQETPCAAKDLYRSTLFKAQRELAQALSQQWFILSAKYGLLHPDEQVEWYECTLNGQPIAKKKDWAKSVSISLHHRLKGARRIVITAGESYCHYLIPLLREHGHQLYRPLQGVSMFFQPGRLRELTREAQSHGDLSHSGWGPI